MLELPQSLKAERSVLGSALFDSSVMDGLDLVASDFFLKKHQVLWEAYEHLNSTKRFFDPIMVGEYLNNEGKLNEIGGYDYLTELQDYTLVPSYSQHYASEVKQKSELRQEIDVLQKALNLAYEGESQSDEVIGQLMGRKPLESKCVANIHTDWEQARLGMVNSIPTPYPEMDKRTGGIRKKMVTIFTGRSKSGKSMFLSHWYNYLGKQGIPILAVPLEDKYEITIKRMASNHGNYEGGVLDAGGRYINYNGKPKWTVATDQEIAKGKQALEEVSKYPVHFWDKKITPKQLKSIAMKYKRKHDIQAMFVDGAKDLKRPSGKYNDTGFDEEISQAMCEIAEDLEIAVISIHHLTKLPDYEMITNNHIRGSGNIVGDSRSVYALQSLGIEDMIQKFGYTPDYDEQMNLTTRMFHCISNNHGTTSLKVLNTNLAKCQFIEKHKGE